MQYDPQQNDKVIPDLAENWERSSDGKTYAFSLRKGIKWHDGKPFTAEDARISLDRVRKPPRGTRSPRMAVFNSVANVEAVNDATLRVTLEKPAASFIANLATGWMLMMPKHIIEAKGDMKKDAVGTGPFKLKDYSPGTTYELVKNPDYFVPGRPYLNGIKNYVIRDRSTWFAAFRTGQIMMTRPGTTAISPSQAVMLEKEMPQKIAILKAPSLNFHSFMMNARGKPWDDARLRKAASMAIDRPAAIEVLGQGEGDLGGPMPPNGQWGFPKDDLGKMPGYRTDKAAELAEAKTLLAAAGQASGFKPNILVRSGTEKEDIAVFVQSQLSKIGVEATITVKEAAAFENDMAASSFASAVIPHAAALDDPDQIFGEHYLSTSARNYQGIRNPKVDELFSQQSSTLDPEQRRKLVVEMQRHVIEDNGKLAIFWLRDRQAMWLKVRNYKVGYGLHNNNKYQDVWLSE